MNTASSSPPALHSPHLYLSLLRGCTQREGALKLSAVGFTSSDLFLKQQQHKVLVWLSGNLKPWRQSYPAACQERQRSRTARRVRPQGSPARARASDAGVLGQNAPGDEIGQENPQVTVGKRGRGGRRQGPCCRKEWGGGWGDNGRKCYFNNFAKKPAGDWVVGEGGQGLTPPLPPPPPPRHEDQGPRSPSAGGRAAGGALTLGPVVRWPRAGDSCTNTSSKWGVSRRAQRAGSMVPGGPCTGLRAGVAGSAGRTAAPAFLPSFPRVPWRRRAAGRGGTARAR